VDLDDDVALADVKIPDHECPPARNPQAAADEIEAMYPDAFGRGPTRAEYEQRKHEHYGKNTPTAGALLSSYLRLGLTIDQVAMALGTTREIVAHELATPNVDADTILAIDNLARVHDVKTRAELRRQVGCTDGQLKWTLSKLGIKLPSRHFTRKYDNAFIEQAVELWADGATYQEISEELGIPRSTAAYLVNQAKAKFVDEAGAA
jgi:hypothetical protein